MILRSDTNSNDLKSTWKMVLSPEAWGMSREESTWRGGDWVLSSAQERIEEWVRCRKAIVIYWKWKYIVERKVWATSDKESPEKVAIGFYPSWGGELDVPSMWFIHLFSLDWTLCFLLFLPYWVSLELSWSQIHDGSHSNPNVNKVIMAL